MKTTFNSRWALPLAILAVAIVLAYIYYTGIYCSDDTRYLSGIQKIAAGLPIDLSSIAERRMFFLLPGALTYWMFGTIDSAVVTYAGFYVGLVMLAWLMMRRFGRATAAFTALLCALTPILFVYAGTLSPDLMSAFLSALLLYCLAKWQKRRATGKGGLPWLSAAAGMVAMCGVAVKESNAVTASLAFAFFGIVFILDFRTQATRRSVATFLAGVLSFSLVESILYRVFAGEWHSSLQNSAEAHGFAKFLESEGIYPIQRFDFLATVLDWWTLFLFTLALIAIIYFFLLWIWKKEHKNYLSLIIYTAFFAWPLLYFTIGSSSFHHYMPPPMQARYYAPCVLPAAALIALMWRSIGGFSKIFAYFLALGIFAFLSFGTYVKYGDRGTSYWSRAKDSYNIAISDAHRIHPTWPILDGGRTVSKGVGRCVGLALGKPAFEVAESSTTGTSVSPPFFITAFDGDAARDKRTPLETLVSEKVVQGEWHLEFVGYYFAATDSDDFLWWRPRQEAIKIEFANGKLGFKEAIKPTKHMTWLKREMHAELYQVTKK